MTPTKPPHRTVKKPPSKPGGTPDKTEPARQPKKFTLSSSGADESGERILIYGKSGIGKTTLASMAPSPIVLPIDTGGAKAFNPTTYEPIRTIRGVKTFEDVRDALGQTDLFTPLDTLVIDTWTKLEEIVDDYIVRTIKKRGERVSSVRDFGWDGERHVLDCYRLLLSDLDRLVERGVSVVLLCQLAQVNVANAEGADFLEDGPKLQHRKDCSVRTETIEWCDHVFRIGYLDLDVLVERDRKVGKVRQSDATRAVYCGGAAHFIGKSRPITRNRKTPFRMPPAVTFESETDGSLWEYLFQGAEIPE